MKIAIIIIVSIVLLTLILPYLNVSAIFAYMGQLGFIGQFVTALATILLGLYTLLTEYTYVFLVVFFFAFTYLCTTLLKTFLK